MWTRWSSLYYTVAPQFLGFAQNSIPSHILVLLLVEISTFWSYSWLSTCPSNSSSLCCTCFSYRCVLSSLAVCTAHKASRVLCSLVQFAFLPTLEASSRGSWPHWLHPSCVHLASISWHWSGPIPWAGAQWGAPAVLGKLDLHPVPHRFETDTRDLHWLSSVNHCPAALTSLSHPESKVISETMHWYGPLMASCIQDTQRYKG